MSTFDPSSFLQSLFGGGGSQSLGMSALLPALVSGAHGLYNSGKYMENAERASKMASPVDQATRQRYQDRLNLFYTDPAAFLEGNPEYMANKKMGVAALNARNASRGNIGDGRATQDELTFLSDLGSRYINQERDDLTALGGFQFNPAAGAEMLMRGGEQEIQARSNALAALAYPFGAGQGPGRGPTGTQPPGGMPQGAGGLLQAISQMPLSSIPPGLFQQLGMIPGGIQALFGTDPGVAMELQRIGLTDNGDGTFNYSAPVETGVPPPAGMGGPGIWGGMPPGSSVYEGPGFDWEGWLETLEDPNFDFSTWFDDSSGGFDWTFGL